MQISLSIILDVLQSYSLETHVGDDDPVSFTKCLPLPDGTAEPEDKCLYVGGLSKAMAMCRNHPHVLHLPARQNQRQPGNDECLSGLIVVNENITINTLFTLVQNRFLRGPRLDTANARSADPEGLDPGNH
jgi:hypothetical protein